VNPYPTRSASSNFETQLHVFIQVRIELVGIPMKVDQDSGLMVISVPGSM
jgi:hypothetical protein